MKKFVSLIILTLALITVAGCNGITNTPFNPSSTAVLIISTPDSQTPPPSITPEPTPDEDIRNTEIYKKLEINCIQFSYDYKQYVFAAGNVSTSKDLCCLVVNDNTAGIYNNKIIRNYSTDNIIVNNSDEKIVEFIDSSDYCIGFSSIMWSPNGNSFAFTAEYKKSDSRVFIYDLNSNYLFDTSILISSSHYVFPSYIYNNFNNSIFPYKWDQSGRYLLMRSECYVKYEYGSTSLSYYNYIITYSIDNKNRGLLLTESSSGVYGGIADFYSVENELIYIVRKPIDNGLSIFAEKQGVFIVNQSGMQKLLYEFDMDGGIVTCNRALFSTNDDAVVFNTQKYNSKTGILSSILIKLDIKTGKTNTIYSENYDTKSGDPYVQQYLLPSLSQNNFIFLGAQSFIYNDGQIKYITNNKNDAASSFDNLYSVIWNKNDSLIALKTYNPQTQDYFYYVFDKDGNIKNSAYSSNILVTENCDKIFDIAAAS